MTEVEEVKMNDCTNVNCKFNFEGDCQLMHLKIDNKGICLSQMLSQEQAQEQFFLAVASDR